MDEQEYQDWCTKHEVDLQKLRGELAEQLGVDEVPSVIWKDLLQRRDPYYAVVGGEDSFNEAVIETKRLFKIWRGSSGEGGRTGQEYYRHLSDHEIERAKVKAQVLAKHASADARVREFRDRFLGGETLTSEQVQVFVASLANQHLPTRWFDEHGVSVTDHHTTAAQQVNLQGRPQFIEFTVQPAGIECRVEGGVLLEEYEDKILVVVGDPGRGYWRGYTGHVRADSPLGVLRDLGAHLTKRYRGWRANHATRFVLTGEAPEIRPLVVERQGSTITMHVESWISADSVQNAYRSELQFSEWQGKRYGSGRSSRWNRRISDKNLKLLQFVTERIDTHGRRPQDGKALVAEWDAQEWVREWDAQKEVEENPRKRASYKGDTRRFWRDYNRAMRLVAPTAAAPKQPQSLKVFDGYPTVPGTTTA